MIFLATFGTTEGTMTMTQLKTLKTATSRQPFNFVIATQEVDLINPVSILATTFLFFRFVCVAVLASQDQHFTAFQDGAFALHRFTKWVFNLHKHVTVQSRCKALHQAVDIVGFSSRLVTCA